MIGFFFFARKREIVWGVFLGILLVFFGVLGVFVFVFRALARIFFGFIFRDEPSKAGNLCPATPRFSQLHYANTGPAEPRMWRRGAARHSPPPNTPASRPLLSPKLYSTSP